MTLTFVPKLVAAMLTFMVFGHWMLSVLTDYTIRMVDSIHLLGGH